MSTTQPAQRLMKANLVRWIGRILAAALLLLFAAFWIGEGPPPLNATTLALCSALLGLILAWYSDLAGSCLILLGAGCFYLVHIAQSGRFPGGWVFPMLFLPGLLLLYSYYLRHQRAAS